MKIKRIDQGKGEREVVPVAKKGRSRERQELGAAPVNGKVT
jgi:hypothetical protein